MGNNTHSFKKSHPKKFALQVMPLAGFHTIIVADLLNLKAKCMPPFYNPKITNKTDGYKKSVTESWVKIPIVVYPN